MKTIWKLIAISVVFAMIAAACAPAPAPAPGQVEVTRVVKETVVVKEVVKETVIVKEEVKVEVPAPVAPAALQENTPIVTAVKVAAIPAITEEWTPPGKDSELWKDVPVTRIGDTTWQAVYSDDDIAFLIKYPKFSLSLDTAGTYLWDPATKNWSQTDIYGHRGEYTGLVWNMTDVPLQEEGCMAFCHEYPPGSGIMHHNTVPGGGVVDNWIFFGKHSFAFYGVSDSPSGYAAIAPGTVQEGWNLEVNVKDYGLKEGNEDAGWLEGQVLAKQDGPVVFLSPDNPKQNRSVIAGDLTFVGYAEDNAIGPNDHPMVLDRSRERDLYCIQCHVDVGLPYNPLEQNATFPDPGEIKYDGNYDIAYGPPKYMEIKPTDFVDALTITEEEIANGEAVLVADLTPAQIDEYWANYVAVNGVVPRLTFKTPTGSMADVTSAMNWKNGRMVVEFHRARVTPETEFDVQFDDLTKDYLFDCAGPFGAGILRLQP